MLSRHSGVAQFFVPVSGYLPMAHECGRVPRIIGVNLFHRLGYLLMKGDACGRGQTVPQPFTQLLMGSPSMVMLSWRPKPSHSARTRSRW